MNRPNRADIAAVILIVYFLPIIALSGYGVSLMPLKQGWNLFSIGIAGSFIGSLALFIMICRWNALRTPTEAPVAQEIESIAEEIEPTDIPVTDHLEQAITEWQQKYESQLTELQRKEEELRQFQETQEQTQQQQTLISQELETYRNASEEQLQFKEQTLQESQQLVREQRAQIEKQQQHIAFLESKERDLHYEIKTLLQLTSYEAPAEEKSAAAHTLVEEEDFSSSNTQFAPATPSAMHTPELASIQLKRFLDTATKMTGAHYYGNHATRLPVDNYALDLRRLCDTLSDEKSYIVFVYSQKENKLLYTNGQVKNVLGCAPEKFTQHFPELVSDQSEEWKKGVSQLPTTPEVRVALSMKARSGQNVPLQCYMGAIHTGLFRYHAIGLMYQPAESK
ncbi:MAG: hypothetical protein H0X51_00825 [Parachlamydiaceae bacterium]|nr:hypothetical protein [Parachlamydiaceae bacterium]